MKRLLNGCAKSPYIAEAFEKKGWEVWTCDLLPAEGNQNHIQDDVLNHLNDGWDMAIFHPDCTHLTNAGVRWLHERNRWNDLVDAAFFFNELLNAPIDKIVIENPIQHQHARALIRKYDQIIQPWNFGELESKAICLWLKNVPPLIKNITVKPAGVKQSVWLAAPSLTRKEDRSRNFVKVSNAMADQWG